MAQVKVACVQGSDMDLSINGKAVLVPEPGDDGGFSLGLEILLDPAANLIVRPG